MSTLRKFSSLLTLIVALSVISCGKKERDPFAEEEKGEGEAAATAMAVVDMANGATLTGTISLDGAAPAAQQIKMDADPVCKSAHSTPQMDDFWKVDGTGGVANAFVYISGGLGGKQYAPGAQASLEQKGCMYTPRVLGVVAGSEIKISNDDATLHNVHAFGAKNETFNEGQAAGSAPKIKKLENEEVMIPFKCDVHGWMKSYVGVLKHPFFAVTGPDGKFEIKGIPAGKYTIRVWHESSKGTPEGVFAESQIEVAAKDAKTLDIKVKPE